MTRGRTAARIAVRVAVLAVVAALGWRYLRTVDWRPVFDETRRAEPLRLVAVALLCVLMAPLKALRTRLLLAPFRVLPLGELVDWYFASWAADNVLMSQAGVGLRVALVRAAGVPLLTAAAEQALEKVVEGATLLALLPLVPHRLLPPSWSAAMARPLVLAAGAAGLVAACALLVSLARRRPELRHLIDAGQALKRPVVAAAVVALSLGLWVIEIGMVALTLAALGLPWDTGVCALVVVAVNLAAVVPGLPGNLGTFEAVATAALVAAGLAPGPALGAAILYHALHTVPVTLLGLTTLRRLRR